MSANHGRHVCLAAAVLLIVLAGPAARTVAQGSQPRPPAFTPGVLLIASMDEARVDIVDEATLQTVASVETGKGPHEVRIAPDGRSAYVVAGRIITAIDLSTRTVRRTFDLGEFSAHDVRISRDGRRFWAACARQQTVLEVDTETGAVTNRFPTSRDGAWFVEVNQAETKFYTPNLEGTSISVIARASKDVKVLPLEYQAYGIDITPDGRHVLVSALDGRGLAIVDTAGDTIVRTIETTETGRVRITPDGRRVVATRKQSVAVIDIATGRVIRDIALPASPKVMTISGDGRRAYVSNPTDHTATVIDLEGGRVVATIKTGRRPDGIAWVPSRSEMAH